jgi:hypothetical protein
MDERITMIARTLHDLQARGGYTVFYNFSGHVNALDVRIYKGKWKRNKKPVLNKLFDLNRPGLYDLYDGSTTTPEELVTLIEL